MEDDGQEELTKTWTSSTTTTRNSLIGGKETGGGDDENDSNTQRIWKTQSAPRVEARYNKQMRQKTYNGHLLDESQDDDLEEFELDDMTKLLVSSKKVNHGNSSSSSSSRASSKHGRIKETAFTGSVTDSHRDLDSPDGDGESPDGPRGHKQEGELKRTLGLVGGVALIIGTMIGSGIFASPGAVLLQAYTPGLSLAAWIAGGIIALMGALRLALAFFL